MKVNPIGWFEIYVNDPPRAKKFYETMLDTKFEKLSTDDSHLEMLGFPMDMETMGAGGALVKMEGVEAGNNSVIVYFKSDDCSIEEKKVSSAGGVVFKPKFAIGKYGFISLVKDTEGNMIGLHSMK
jgi:predicted enzyme related to lactoylglutathione lyase